MGSQAALKKAVCGSHIGVGEDSGNHGCLCRELWELPWDAPKWEVLASGLPGFQTRLGAARVQQVGFGLLVGHPSL